MDIAPTLLDYGAKPNADSKVCANFCSVLFNPKALTTYNKFTFIVGRHCMPDNRLLYISVDY